MPDDIEVNPAAGLQPLWNQAIVNARPRAARPIAGILDELAPVGGFEVFLQDAALKKQSTASEYDTQIMGQIWSIKIHDRVIKAMAAHPGEIIKGIELEIENWPENWADSSAVGFTFTEDGSLRNNGTEAVSHPNNTRGLLAVTEQLWKKFNIQSDKNFSDRTSIHVHANVFDFTGAQFKAITLLYQVFEELLFAYVGDDRANNIFCVPWYEAGVTAFNHQLMVKSPRGWNKYTALNLAPVASQGSIEFRHMAGHADITKLAGWLNIIDDLMLSAKKTDYNSVIDRIQNINTNSQYAEFLYSIFPNTGSLLKTADYERKMSRGVVEAKLALVGA